MFGKSTSNSIFGKGSKTGSAAAPKNAFSFAGFGDENDSPSDLFGTTFSAEPGLNDFGNKKDAGDSIFKMPEPPGSHPPLQQQQDLEHYLKHLIEKESQDYNQQDETNMDKLG